ncbi:MAG: hypothetical protein RSA51_07330 [Niameybacter sp.]
MKRQSGEQYTTFVKRITDYKKKGMINYEEWGDALLGAENPYCSENLRKAFRIVDLVVDKFDEDGEESDETILQELETLKVDLFKERVKLRDQRRELGKLHTRQARFEHLVELLEERLNEVGTLPRNIQYKPSTEHIEPNRGGVLIVSDLHYGIRVDNAFNYFDKEVAEARLQELADKTIRHCKGHRVNCLNIELLGDLVSGTIHTGIRVQQEEDIIQQIIDCSELLAEFINVLSEHIETVNVYGVYGNHGRTEANKHDGVNRENYERLIYHFLKNRVSGVRFVDSYGEDFIKYEAFGKTFVITHGDKDKMGSAVAAYSRMFGALVDEVHMGHFHEFKETNEYDIPVIVNGSIIGSDDYAVSIRKVSKPCQVLKIYGEDECLYKLILK